MARKTKIGRGGFQKVCLHNKSRCFGASFLGLTHALNSR